MEYQEVMLFLNDEDTFTSARGSFLLFVNGDCSDLEVDSLDEIEDLYETHRVPVGPTTDPAHMKLLIDIFFPNGNLGKNLAGELVIFTGVQG
jgi:hypothetical protein